MTKYEGRQEPAWGGIMTEFCTRVHDYTGGVSSCRTNPLVGSSPPACSVLFDTTVGATECRSWYFETLEVLERVALQDRICQDTDLVECGCVSRGFDDVYQAVASAYPFLDSCWWIPCRDDLNFMIPPSLVDPVCPSNVCQQIIQVVNANNVDIDRISFTISCSFAPDTRTYSCIEDVGCVISGCREGDENCYRNDPTCNNNCEEATTFRCFQGECEPTECDPTDDTECSTSPACVDGCAQYNGTWLYDSGTCRQTACNSVTNPSCYTDPTCGGLVPGGSPNNGIPGHLDIPSIAGIVAAVVVLIIIVILAVWGANRAKKRSSANVVAPASGNLQRR